MSRDGTMNDECGRLERIFDDLVDGAGVPARQRTRVNCPGWDSFMQLTLIMVIEEEFGITIGDDDAIDLVSFAAALEIIREKLAQK